MKKPINKILKKEVRLCQAIFGYQYLKGGHWQTASHLSCSLPPMGTYNSSPTMCLHSRKPDGFLRMSISFRCPLRSADPFRLCCTRRKSMDFRGCTFHYAVSSTLLRHSKAQRVFCGFS